MSYQALVAKAVNGNIPLSVLLELTYRCNLDCYYCYNDRASAGQPLSVAQYVTLFRDLRELGTMNLTFSGGEPLAHADFFTLGAQARALGFVTRVKTNGHGLTPRLARRLREEVDPYVVEISLHGASAGTHERQTRVAGSFGRLLKNLKRLRELGLRVQLNATLTAWNESEIEAMSALAQELNMPLRWNTQVTPRDDGDRAPLGIAPSHQAVARLGELLALGLGTESSDESDPQTPWGKYCGAAASGFTVDPWGNLYPCVQWRVAAGNLHRASVREIWGQSATLRAVRARTEALAAAVKDEGPGVMGGWSCPALAERAGQIRVGLPDPFKTAEHRTQSAAAAAGSSEGSIQ
jgi:mycofactocin biosynthetic radical S-adenosylmethionine protein MftC